jgi:cytochrome c oxidase cbb3-type subunit 3
MSDQNLNKDKNVILNDEEKKLLLDHNYDGIEEFDYPLPSWWVTAFYGGIIFAVIYFIYFEMMGAAGIRENFDKKWEKVAAIRAEAAKNVELFDLNEYNAVAIKPDSLTKGEAIFVENCVACHKEKGIGDIGPNLTDPYWIHVTEVTPKSLHPIIANGVEEEGMPAWKDILSKEDVYDVINYLMSIKDLNLAGKEPQGNKI